MRLRDDVVAPSLNLIEETADLVLDDAEPVVIAAAHTGTLLPPLLQGFLISSNVLLRACSRRTSILPTMTIATL